MLMINLNRNLIKIILLSGIIVFALACPLITPIHGADLPVVARDVNSGFDDLIDLSRFKVNSLGTTATLSFTTTTIVNLVSPDILTTATLDNRFLLLTAANDPLTGDLQIAKVGGGNFNILDTNTGESITISTDPVNSSGIGSSLPLAISTEVGDIQFTPFSTFSIFNGTIRSSTLTANTLLQANANRDITSVANGSTSQVLTLTSTGAKVWRTPSVGAGTVTSVGTTVPSDLLAVSGVPITGSGTIAITLPTRSANTVFAGPTTGAVATPTFRSLVGADLPSPTASTLGGVLSIAAVTSNWIRSISTSGIPALSQPAFTDISGTAATAQLPVVPLNKGGTAVANTTAAAGTFPRGNATGFATSVLQLPNSSTAGQFVFTNVINSWDTTNLITADTGVPLLSMDNSSVVINDTGVSSYVFRAEGDNDTNLICTDPPNDRVGFGTASPTDKIDARGGIASNVLSGTAFAASRFNNDTFSPSLQLIKSRGATVGSFTIVQNGDELGRVSYRGANGTGVNTGAELIANVDGTPGATNDMPGRWAVFTTPDGSGTTVEGLRVSQSQDVLVRAGASTGVIAAVGGVLNVNITAVGNTTTGVTNLQTYTIPANTLATNGDTLRVSISGSTANTATVKTLEIDFGATAIVNTGTFGAALPSNWTFTGLISRTGAATQRITGLLSINNSATGAVVLSRVINTTAAETLSGTVVFKSTGNVGVGAASNDIVSNQLVAEWLSVGL